ILGSASFGAPRPTKMITRPAIAKAAQLRMIRFMDLSLLCWISSWTPAATEGAKRPHRRSRRTLPGYGQVVLGRKQLPIRVEHVGQADDPGSVRLFRQVAHALQFSDSTKNFIASVLGLDE